MPDRFDDYRLPSWPPTKITREIWNAVLGDIGVRLRDREALEASFELLQQQGIQAALDYIQVSVAPQLSDLQRTIQESKDQIDDLLQGNAPNAHKLGGQLPAYYAKASDVQSLLQVVADKADADDVTALIQQRIAALVDSSPATLDTLKELAAALGNDANFSVTVTNALAELETKIKQAGAPIGTTIMMQGNGNTPPPGYLLHNGAPCTSAYPQLRAWLLANGATVNGNGDPIIEDMGGYFARGWRPGQVVDSGRVFGSMQQDALQNITGSIGGRNEYYGGSGTGAFAVGAEVGGARAEGNNPVRGFTFDASRVARTASETRPANKTFTYWIKAYAAEQVAGAADLAALLNSVQTLQNKVNATGVKRGGKVAPSGVSVLYTGIPAGVARFKVRLSDIGFSAQTEPFLKVGGASGVVSSGYDMVTGIIQQATGYSARNILTDIRLGGTVNVALSGSIEFTRVPGTSHWLFDGQMSLPGITQAGTVQGRVLLNEELDRFQLTTTAGTATMSAGSAAGGIWAEWEFAA